MIGQQLYQGGYPLPSTLTGESGKLYVLTRPVFSARDTVFRGITANPETAVADQVFIKAYVAPGYWANYKRERKAVEALRGDAPNTLLPIDTVRIDNRAGRASHRMRFFIYPWLDALTLGEHVNTHGALSLAETVNLLTQLKPTFDYAHICGVYDRDIKADNILVLENPRRYLRTDFGTTSTGNRLIDRKKTAIVGTSQTIPLETMLQQEPRATEQTEVYQLALLVYHALSGRLPYPEIEEHAMPFHILVKYLLLCEQPQFVKANQLPYPSVASVIQKAADARPPIRFRTVRDFIDLFVAEAKDEAATTDGKQSL